MSKNTPLQIAVVLGSGLTSAGRASAVTRIRALHAAKLAKTLPLDSIILSGYGPPGCEKLYGRSEAAVMAALVRRHRGRKNRARLKLEDQSFDTFGNAIFTVKRFLGGEEPGTLHIVTSPFHMERAVYMFAHLAPAWQIVAQPSEEWEKEDRAPGAPAAMERARAFFADIPRGDVEEAYRRLMSRKPYSDVTRAA